MNYSQMPWFAIVEDIDAKIRSGHWKPGEKLPSLKELREHYGKSHGTILTVMAVLRDRGLTYGRQGVGIYVREQEDHL